MNTMKQWLARHPKAAHFAAEFTTRTGIEVALHALGVTIIGSILIRIVIEGVIALRT